MSFHVVDCEQRTPAWFAARIGVLTASCAAAMLSKPKRGGEETVGKTELRLRLALESLRGEAIEEDRYESDYMRRGREREAAALGAYEAMTGEIVQRVGFLRHDTLAIGCSPDGIVGDFEGGVETKAPKYTTHWDYLQQHRLPPEYAAQVTHSLYVTGLPWWDFCSYCPEFEGGARLFQVRVYAGDVDLDSYALAFALFWREVETVKQSLRDLSRASEEMACA
jgi:hypothetical protein